MTLDHNWNFPAQDGPENGQQVSKIAQYRGELETARAKVESIEAGVTRLSSLHERIVGLEEVIRASEILLKREHPEAQPAKIKPVRAREWKSPFKSGEIGRTALSVLREAGNWMRPSEIARAMLERIAHDGNDRIEWEKSANSVDAYFRKHEGNLVESRGDYTREWQVIR